MADKRVSDRIYDCSFSIIVRGDSLDFGAISTCLGMEATRVVRKGDVLNKLPQIIAQKDAWFHEEPLTNPDGADEVLRGMLAVLIEHKEALTVLEAQDQVTLRLQVRSDKAQFSYKLMPETLAMLTQTGVALDVSSLSWGEI